MAEQQDALRKLQLENAELKMENEMLKSRGLLCEKSEVKYELIHNILISVTKWAAVLEVSTSYIL